ncbi:hypothetical protein D3C71_2220420 [compost metagenome]
MSALLHDLPMIQYNNLVGMLHGFEPVSDDDQGSTSNKSIDRLLNLRFVLGI